MGLEHKIISGARWSAIGIWGRKLISFATFAVIARHVSPDSLGLVALAMIYIAFVEMFSKQGLGMALIQKKELKHKHTNTAFLINLAAAMLLAVLSLAFANPISVLLGDERLATIIRVLAVTFPFNAANVVPVALQSRAFDFKSQAFQTFLGTFVAGAVSIALAILGYEVWALVVQSIIFSVVCSITIWLRTTWRPSVLFDWTEARELTVFSSKILLSNIVGFTRARSDQIFIGIAAGPIGLGLYVLGLKLTETIDSIIRAPLDRVMVSAFSNLQDDRPRLLRAICRATRLNSLVACPVMVGVALLAPEVVTLLFSSKWSGAATVCSIIALNRLSISLFFLNYHVFISQGFPGVQTLLQLAQAVGVVIASLVGQAWGIEGVAIGVAISGFVLNILNTFVMGKTVGIRVRPIFMSMVVPVVAAVVMAGVVEASRSFVIPADESDIVRLLVLSALGAAAYGLSIRVMSKNLAADAVDLSRKILIRGKSQPVR